MPSTDTAAAKILDTFLLKYLRAIENYNAREAEDLRNEFEKSYRREIISECQNRLYEKGIPDMLVSLEELKSLTPSK